MAQAKKTNQNRQVKKVFGVLFILYLIAKEQRKRPQRYWVIRVGKKMFVKKKNGLTGDDNSCYVDVIFASAL